MQDWTLQRLRAGLSEGSAALLELVPTVSVLIRRQMKHPERVNNKSLLYSFPLLYEF